MLYFDHNASSPLHPAARQAWVDACEQFPGNPSSPHRLGSRAEAALTRARERLAAFLGCRPLDLVWTSGATESNNLALHHLARALDADAEVWVSAIEHPSLLEPARHWFGSRVKLMPVTRGGVLDLGWVANQLKSHRPGAVAVMAANNETGVLQPWREALQLCRERGVPFLCDAVQWVGKLGAAGLGDCDFVSGSGHKFGGPRGVGFLKVPSRGRFHALLRGGPQEEGRRAGTENVPGVLAMVAALAVREAALGRSGGAGEGSGVAETPGEGGDALTRSTGDGVRHSSLATRIAWRDEFIDALARRLPGIEIVGVNQERLWNTVSVIMPDADCRSRWVVKLDKAGFAVSTGSACASGKESPSHVLTAMGYTPGEASRALRFSARWETTREDWQRLAEGVAAVAAEAALAG